MALDRRSWLWIPGRLWPSGRRAILLAILAGSLILLACLSGRMWHWYRLSAVDRALRSGDWQSAIAMLERTDQRGQNSAQWHYLAGRAYRRSGNAVLAEQHLARAAEYGWNGEEVRLQQLLLQAQGGQIKSLEGQLAERLQAGVDDTSAEEIYESMARGYLASYHIADALKCLKFWGDWQPNNPLPHLWRADLYQRIEKREAAMEEYEQVLALRPRHAEASLKLAQLRLELSDLTSAAGLFQACLDQDSENAEALLGLAECRARQGLGDQSQALLYDALLLDLTPGKAAAALARLGQAALEERDDARAIYFLEKSVALDPREAKSHLTLASALATVGDDQEAQRHRNAARELTDQHTRLVSVTRRIATEPNNADLRCEAGLILMKQGLLPAGAAWLKSAVQIDPNHQAAHRGLAEFYTRIGQPDQARRHQQIAGQHPAPPSTLPVDEQG
ncbi:MAG: tetratricopeptide repeat protein [Planctomycetaceae bacterium]|nr:tetratricopeptide repeat protein [Planctomycetaceae bacterium]